MVESRWRNVSGGAAGGMRAGARGAGSSARSGSGRRPLPGSAAADSTDWCDAGAGREIGPCP